MRKRLRKKLRREEFTQYGFHLDFTVDGDPDAIVDGLLDYGIDRGLSIGGVIAGRCLMYVAACGCRPCGGRRRNATEYDRQALMAYLRNAGATEVYVGSLLDVMAE